MTFRFFPSRKQLNDPQWVRKHATRVDSAERAWPRLRNTRTLEENREAMERIRRYREDVDG